MGHVGDVELDFVAISVRSETASLAQRRPVSIISSGSRRSEQTSLRTSSCLVDLGPPSHVLPPPSGTPRDQRAVCAALACCSRRVGVSAPDSLRSLFAQGDNAERRFGTTTAWPQYRASIRYVTHSGHFTRVGDGSEPTDVHSYRK